MSRLLAFGCSYTYGEGLEDCWIAERETHAETPSKFAWPSLVATELNRELYNYGVPGASNKLIWYNILNTIFKEDDLVIVLWTHFNRSCIIRDDGTTKRLIPSDIKRKKRFTRNYYQEYWSSLDSNLDSFNRINHIDYYLKAKKIEVYHYTAEIEYTVPSWNTTKLISVPLYYNLFDLAADNKHPGKQSQLNLAKIMLQNLANEKN